MKPSQRPPALSKSALLARGWTRKAISVLLGQPDYVLANAMNRSRQCRMHSLARVLDAEELLLATLPS